MHGPVNFVESVQHLSPIIESAADQAEREHQLPADLLDALHQNSLFRLLLPKPFGGYELDPASFCMATTFPAPIAPAILDKAAISFGEKSFDKSIPDISSAVGSGTTQGGHFSLR